MIAAAPSQAVQGRHALLEHGDPVHVSFWAVAALLALALVLDLPLDRPAPIAIATVAFIGGGLPHGAYDIALLRRATTLDRGVLVLAIGGYMAAAAAMAMLWATMPLVALVAFLAVACVHFGEDWEMLDEPLLRVSAGAAILVAPAIGHQADVARLFVAMSDARAIQVARVLTAAAPVALLVTAVGIMIAWREGSRSWAAAMTLCLGLLVAAPPVFGFALFFVFLHSPRHLAHTRTMLHDMGVARWLFTGAALSIAALAGWWLLQVLALAPRGGDLAAVAFQLLAAVAVPHLLLSRWVDRKLAEAGTLSSS